MPNQSIVRVAVVGFGKLGLLHSALSNGLSQSKLVAIVDNSSTSLDMLRSLLKDVRTYTRHQDLIQEGGIDAVYIATPTHLHVPIAVDFIKAGIPVFIEKPLSIDTKTSLPILKALEERPVANMVGYMYRYLDTVQKAKEIIDSGALGKLQMLKSSMYISQLFRTGKGWRYQQETSGGGVLITQNSHLLDLLRFFFGEVDWVSGQTSQLYSSQVEDSAHAFFQFKNGLKGWMDSSWSSRHYRTLTMQIHVQGERGTLDVNEDEVKLYLDDQYQDYKAGWSKWLKPDLYKGVETDVGGVHYTRQAQAFLDAIQKSEKVEADVESAFEVQRLMDAIYESARNNGAPVKVLAEEGIRGQR
jgi:predicted dehydrogenase